ncbi:hypothetical protein BD410DRAFT_829485 [Rickenella mellea]|uniref:F-box domain-containing protein n=1 Tax=Rickenella mellea TaxID=50990 RepID=A0A4Y7Q217_9AGAM|nr:hypothetical protein BD410DRAFT_829485 [Rickenella mellea]
MTAFVLLQRPLNIPPDLVRRALWMEATITVQKDGWFFTEKDRKRLPVGILLVQLNLNLDPKPHVKAGPSWFPGRSYECLCSWIIAHRQVEAAVAFKTPPISFFDFSYILPARCAKVFWMQIVILILGEASVWVAGFIPPGSVELMDSIHNLSQPPRPNATDAIRRVRPPFDVLSIIFFECLPDDGFPCFSRKEAPLLLGRVCSEWRTVALASHILWAKLSIRRHNNGTSLKNPTSAIKEWIGRAGKYALSFHFSTLEFPPLERGKIATVISELPYRARWEHLAGFLTTNEWPIIYSAISEGAPLLQYFNISTVPCYPEICLAATPVLRTLILRSPHNLLGLEACKQSIRHLSVVVEELDEVWHFLVRCPNLEVFELTGPFTMKSVVRGDTSMVLEMPRLFTLELAICAEPLLVRLHAPALRRFRFGCPDNGSVVSTFLHRCRPPLESLIICQVAYQFGSNDLFDCLRYCPGLTRLILGNHTPLDNADMNRLQLGAQRERNICPLLEEIDIMHCVKGNMLHVENMVVSRCKVAHDDGHSTSCMSDQSNQWERNLRKITLGACKFEEYSSDRSTAFIKQPRTAKCIEEGLYVREEPHWLFPEYYSHHDEEALDFADGDSSSAGPVAGFI